MAKYTLQALMSMASGNQLDIQRDERWPHHTQPGKPGEQSTLKVSFDPWEEDSDYSDTEGMMMVGAKVDMERMRMSDDE